MRVKRAWPEVCLPSTPLEEMRINNASSFSNFPVAFSVYPIWPPPLSSPPFQSHGEEASEAELLDRQDAHRAHQSWRCNEELH